MRYWILFLFFLSLGFKAPGQNLEQTMFELIANNIVQQKKFLALKDNFKDIFQAVDPITGETTLHYEEYIEKDLMLEFQKYSNEDQSKILNADTLSLISIEDTLFIVDTLNFFSSHLNILIDDNKTVKVIDYVPKARSNCLFLYKIGVRKDDIILSFLNYDNTLIHSFYFRIKESNFDLYRTNAFENKPHYE